MPRPATCRPARARLTVQPLEDRAVPAFTMTIDGDLATANVTADTSVPGLTTFTATGTGANLSVADLTAALDVGDVVVTSGTGGNEAGSIAWVANTAEDQPPEYTGDLRSLTFRPGSNAAAGQVLFNGVILPFVDNVDLTIDTTLPPAAGNIRLLNDTRVENAHSLALDAGTAVVFWESGNTTATVGSGDFHVTAGAFVNQYDGVAVSADTGDLVFDAPIDLNSFSLGLVSQAGQVVLNQPVNGPGFLGLYGIGGVAVNAGIGTTTPLDQLTLTGGTTTYGTNTIRATDIVVGGNTFDGIDATLGGTGPLVGNVTVEFDGVLAPGGVGTVGTMPVTGTLTFNGGTYAADLGGATADRVDVAGDVNLFTAILGSPDDTGTLTTTADVPIITLTGLVSGVFGNAPAGSGVVLGGDAIQVTSYDPPAITIARIPPVTGGVFGAADQDGTPYTARLTGPGTLTAFRDAADRLNLVASGTTTASSLMVTVKPNASDDLVVLGDVRVNGSLNKFTASGGVVNGNVAATGTIKAVSVYQAFGSLTLGGLATDATSVKADTWFAPITTAGVLSSLNVAKDFTGGVTATAVGTVKVGLTLGGSFPGWNVTNGIKSVSAGRIIDWAVTARFIGTLAAKGNRTAHLAGDILLADIHLTGNDGTVSRYGLKTLTATGAVRFSTFDVQEGSVLSVRVGRFLDSNLYLDYTPTGPFDTGAFDSTGVFKLGTFTTTAATGTNPANPTNWAFANSQVAADTIGSVRLSGVRTDNALTPFGIKFRSAGGSVQVKSADVSDPNLPLNTNLTPSGGPLAGDFFYLPPIS